jgi:hypothetical protein
LTNPGTGIEATAALISDRLTTLGGEGLMPDTDRGHKPATLDLNQFVYGAALYSAGGPSSSRINFAQNDISGLSGLPNSDKLQFSIHYLGEPTQLSDYFSPRR